MIQPSIRYGHGADRHEEKFIVTLGYYYDREKGSPSWMSDTWEMDMAPPYLWNRLDTGISKHHAFEAYNSNKQPYAPAGRFGHSTSIHNDSLLLYGGHDGGVSRHGQHNYEPGYDFDELWAFNIPTRNWKLIQTKGGPGKRYLHSSTVIGDLLILYGGLSEGQGDVWSYDIALREWELLATESPRSETNPGRRVGHTMTAVDQPFLSEVTLDNNLGSNAGSRIRGFLLLGDRKVWRPLGSRGVVPDSAHSFTDMAVPSGRKYHAEASGWVTVSSSGRPEALPTSYPSKQKVRGSWLSGLLLGGQNKEEADVSSTAGASKRKYVHATVITGGTITTPGLTCTAEAWLAVLDCGVTMVTWHRLPDLPVPLYDSRSALSPSSASVFTFGGHLCSETKGEAPFFYTNAVAMLDLTQVQMLMEGACQVYGKDLPLQRGQGQAAMERKVEL
ncbi:hypothetical protein CEUSTIGMA_g4191.t1 [Chlamydomonas eustigma]|uniref:Uncharacterized protein n=1 Tax=Chlamydomonas eustigma TaxID=1157962 RepID=A0A250X0W6_9CHLO|nr:hypothetical protein CEUSTIGMA_g4191.t1 [Chlamydomonas eustigma]|eukprot:GAX76744.1 hypothetical protein CEUSTIGMA_g4191.t1 [Chlamydomonas eustigma]